MTGTPPYRGYMLIGGPEADRLLEVMRASKAGPLAPQSMWGTAQRKVEEAYENRATMVTLDGLRFAHFALTYAVPNGLMPQGIWNTKRNEVANWLQEYILEFMRAAEKRNRGITKSKKKEA
jgi:hypothetical protein